MMNDRNDQQRKKHNSNFDMAKKLEGIKKSLQNSTRPIALSRAATSWEADGVDHINVNSCGVTDIGRFLSHDNNYSFVHPRLGRFVSSRSFWLWLNTVERDDRIRNKLGAAAFAIYRSCKYRQVPNARAIMLDADYHKLLQYPSAIAELLSNNLPLDNYFFDKSTYLNLPRRPANFKWLVGGWEEIRRSLREDRAPVFDRWLDVEGSGIYDYLFNDEGTTPSILTRNSAPAKTSAPRTVNNHRTKAHQVVSVDVSQDNTTVNLDANPALRSEVHSVSITEETPVPTQEVTETIEPALTEDYDILQEEDTTVSEEVTAVTSTDISEVTVTEPVEVETVEEEKQAPSTESLNELIRKYR